MNLASFDFNLLRVLDALLREGSTVGAARRIGLSQPAVSAALSRLRHALNDPLFLRRGQGLVPTDYARSLTDPLHRILTELEQVLDPPIQFDPRSERRDFRISGIDFFAEMLMPALARRLSDEAPGLRVQLVDLMPDGKVERLETHSIDLALLPCESLPDSLPDWVGKQTVFGAGFAVIARKGHPRLRQVGVSPGAVVPLDLFCDLNHVLTSPEGRFSAHTDTALEAVGRARRVVMTMPFFSGVCRAVAQSDLVALVPTPLAYRTASFLPLQVYRAPVSVAPAILSMVWHRRSERTPAMLWLRETVAQELRPLDSEGVAEPDRTQPQSSTTLPDAPPPITSNAVSN